MLDGPPGNLLMIHQDRLEDDCTQQPQLTFVYGQQLADATRKAKLAKNRLKLVEAELSLDARSDPTAYNLSKITEDALKAVVIVHPEYKHAQQALIDAEHEEEVLRAFIYALNDRKEQLGNMTKLHGQMYWSKPAAEENVEPLPKKPKKKPKGV